MAETAVVLKPRDVGRAAARICRKEGLVPGIIYGKSIEPLAVALDALAVKKLIRGTGSHVHHVAVEGATFEGDVMIQEVVYDPLSGKAIHIDLHRISMTEKVKAEVAVVVAGEEFMDKRGLVLQRQLREITVECLPADIPNRVSIDVSNLQHGESVTAGEIALPEKVRLVTAASEVVVVAVSPKLAEEKAEEEPEAAAAEAEAGTDKPAKAEKPENPAN